jgi:hypothetical protein
MYVGRVDSVPDNGLRSTGVDFHVTLSQGLKYSSGIESRVCERSIPVYGGDT